MESPTIVLRARFVRRVFALKSLALSLLAVARLGAVGVTVNAAQPVRTVDERVFGVNSVIWDSEAGTAQTLNLVQAAGIRSIRVPGGSLSDEYHWREKRSGTNDWTWSTNFDKFVGMISGAGAQAMVTVNYGTGTPEEAAALVAYLNSPVGSNVAIGVETRRPGDGTSYDFQNSGVWAALRAASPAPTANPDGMDFLRIGRSAPLGAKYFEIGNECYGSWETDHQALQHDPVTYATRVKAYMQKMKAVDPTIKIGVVAVQTSENASYNNWTPAMLGQLNALGAIPDFIIYHSYPQAPGQESDATLLGLENPGGSNSRNWTSIAANLRGELNTYLGASAAGVEIIVTENNSVFSNPGKQSTSIVNGLYLADSVGRLMQTEINGFNWWALRNGTPDDGTAAKNITGNQSDSLYGWRKYGDYGIISTPHTGGSSSYYECYPAYYMMKLLQHFARQGDTVLGATSDSNLLATYAVKRTDGTITLLVLNKDPANTITANFAVTGSSLASTATVYTYGTSEDRAQSDITMTSENLAVAGGSFSRSFGSYSATVLVFSTAVAPAFTTQPTGQTVLTGVPVTFVAAASGAPAPTYQWRKNGSAIVGATGSSYTIGSVALTDAGTYSVVATNASGSVPSADATLTVNALPSFTQQPLSQSVYAGASVTLNATVTGTPAPAYQWQKDNQNINGANSSSLVLTNLQIADTGSYRLIATNAGGSTYSANAVLMVNAIPSAFDWQGYVARYGDLQANGITTQFAAWMHYYLYGVKEGRVFDDSFRAEEYIGIYPDLYAAFGDNPQAAALHWFAYGRAEGRMGRVPVKFDVDLYLGRYGDVAAALSGMSPGVRRGMAWGHYLDYGSVEGRSPDGYFEAHAYLAQNGDLQAAFGSNNVSAAALHFYLYGRFEGRFVPYHFPAAGYLARYSDLAQAFGNDLYGGWLHYWDYGIDEGRVFDDEFRVDEYLAMYADLRAAFGTDRRAALMHWLLYGKAEGRKGRF